MLIAAAQVSTPINVRTDLVGIPGTAATQPIRRIPSQKGYQNEQKVDAVAWPLLVSSRARNAGVRIQTRRVTHGQNGKMVLRWIASAFSRAEKLFERIMGHRDLCPGRDPQPSATANQTAA